MLEVMYNDQLVHKVVFKFEHFLELVYEQKR